MIFYMSKSILITNDDGIYAEGIQVMSQKIFEMYNNRWDINIVAPNHEQSAVGHAITMHRPLRVQPARFMHNRDLKGWAVNGTPSDCVKLAVEALLPQRPDLVVSGINQGGNLGTDVLYSGTVSAAVEGIILGIPSIAVSLTNPEESDFQYAAEFTAHFLPLLLENPPPPGTILNINVPPGTREEIKGVQATKLSERRYRNAFQKRTDPRGKPYYWLAGSVIDNENDNGFDMGAIKNKYVSVTPIHFDITRYDLLDKVENTLEKIDLFHDKG